MRQRSRGRVLQVQTSASPSACDYNGGGAAMASVRDPGSLGALQEEIESFLHLLHHPMVVESETELFDLTSANWRLSVEFGKLILSVWNSGKSISRRIEDVAYRDRNRLGVFVRKPGRSETSTLEFRELNSTIAVARTTGRGAYREQLLSLLQREYRGWAFERVSNRSDREHSFSARYTRGLSTQGLSGWAFLGMSAEEGVAAADEILAFGLIWVDWLRSRAERVAVTGLKLFLPPGAIASIAHRAAHLNQRVLKVEIFEWSGGQLPARPVDPRDHGNVQTHLAHRRQADALLSTHAGLLRELLGDLFAEVAVSPDSTASFLSLRIAGLEVARIEGLLSPRVFFGLEGSFRRLGQSQREDFRDFLLEVLRVRRASRPEPQHEYFRLQSERWLESMLLKDLSRLDPALSTEDVYSQVPAFSGTDRGVIDILAATRRGRLAVIELKVEEHINLPLQGLDYWLRVKWLQERKQFQDLGYFAGRELSGAPPLLYLVSPAFRFHSSTDRMLAYFDSAIEVIMVGINDGWREGIKVLFRKQLSGGTAQ